MSWFAANEHCKRQGGMLVEIDSEEENTTLVEEINRRGYTNRSMNFWIGLTDFESEGNWSLASDHSKPSYLNWHKNSEPNNGGGFLGNEDCAIIRIGPKPSWKDTWSDLRCKAETVHYWNDGQRQAYSLHALCEFDPLKNNSLTECPSAQETPTKGSRSPKARSPMSAEVTVTVSVLALLLLLTIILLCIFKQQRARRRAAEVRADDVNPTYGDYYDPDDYYDPNPRVEVEDSNAYYCSSDYEAETGTSRTTDKNPYYE